jgi:tol-pal system protein YbgF
MGYRSGMRLDLPRAAPALLLALSSCFVPLERGRMMEARIQKLEVDNVEQNRRIEEQQRAVKERVATVDRKIVEVQQKIDELNQAARRSGADLGVGLSRLQDEFARAKGELEVEQHRLAELDKALAALKADTDGRFAALKGAGALDTFEARQKAAGLGRPDDRSAFLALAQKEEAQGDKGVARELYEEYVRKWPKDAGAAEAGFRAGELHAAQRRWRDALLAYGRVAEGFPRHELAPDAMLGAATAMVELGMKDDARSILEQVVDRYPKTPAAGRAKQRLADLAPPPPPPAEKRKPAPKRK